RGVGLRYRGQLPVLSHHLRRGPLLLRGDLRDRTPHILRGIRHRLRGTQRRGIKLLRLLHSRLLRLGALLRLLRGLLRLRVPLLLRSPPEVIGLPQLLPSRQPTTTLLLLFPRLLLIPPLRLLLLLLSPVRLLKRLRLRGLPPRLLPKRLRLPHHVRGALDLMLTRGRRLRRRHRFPLWPLLLIPRRVNRPLPIPLRSLLLVVSHLPLRLGLSVRLKLRQRIRIGRVTAVRRLYLLLFLDRRL